MDRRYAEKDIIQEIWEYVSTNKILCRHEYPKLNTNYDEFSFQQSNIHILGFAYFFPLLIYSVLSCYLKQMCSDLCDVTLQICHVLQYAIVYKADHRGFMDTHTTHLTRTLSIAPLKQKNVTIIFD